MISKRQQLMTLETELRSVQFSQQFVTKNLTEWQRLEAIIDDYHTKIKALKIEMDHV